MGPITEHEQGEIDAANSSGKTPVVFVHGHALTIDSGWREVADLSLAFIRRFVQP